MCARYLCAPVVGRSVISMVDLDERSGGSAVRAAVGRQACKRFLATPMPHALHHITTMYGHHSATCDAHGAGVVCPPSRRAGRPSARDLCSTLETHAAPIGPRCVPASQHHDPHDPHASESLNPPPLAEPRRERPVARGRHGHHIRAPPAGASKKPRRRGASPAYQPRCTATRCCVASVWLACGSHVARMWHACGTPAGQPPRSHPRAHPCNHA